MKPKELSDKEVVDKFRVGMRTVEAARRDGLERLKSLQTVKNRAQMKEHQRLRAKLGADHPRVRKMANRIKYNESLFKDLHVEIEKAKITVPTVDENSWMLHGRVLDKDRKGVSGLTVGLFDEKGIWVRQLGYGCTDERGHFSIIYAKKDKKEQEILESMKLFLYVSDKNYKILYKDRDPLYLKIGQVDYREIYLPEEGDICSAPEPGKDDTALAPDTWVVKGRVTDEIGRGLGGLTVSIYDKDFIFDDKLGTTVTEEDGHFTVTYLTEEFRDLIEARPDIYLKVLDKEGKTLYSSRKAVRCEAGRVEVFNIKIRSKAKS